MPPDGSVWFGTTALGGGVLRPGATTVERFGPDTGYPELAVYSMFAPAADRVLAGGRDVLAEREHGRWTVRQRALDAVRSVDAGARRHHLDRLRIRRPSASRTASG